MKKRCQHACGAEILFHGDDSLGIFKKKGACQAARTRSHLYGGAVKPTGTSGNAARQIQIEQKILAQRFARAHVEGGNQLFERRQRVDGAVVETLRGCRAVTHGGHAMPSGGPF